MKVPATAPLFDQKPSAELAPTRELDSVGIGGVAEVAKLVRVDDVDTCGVDEAAKKSGVVALIVLLSLLLEDFGRVNAEGAEDEADVDGSMDEVLEEIGEELLSDVGVWVEEDEVEEGTDEADTGEVVVVDKVVVGVVELSEDESESVIVADVDADAGVDCAVTSLTSAIEVVLEAGADEDSVDDPVDVDVTDELLDPPPSCRRSIRADFLRGMIWGFPIDIN